MDAVERELFSGYEPFRSSDQRQQHQQPHGDDRSRHSAYQASAQPPPPGDDWGDSASSFGPLWLAWRVLYPVCLCLLNFCGIIGAWLWLKHPVHLHRLLRWLRARRAGLRFRTVRLDGADYQLAEKGRPDRLRSSLLLFHGVADDCTSWTEFIELVDPQLDHVIAVDLPGHGGSAVGSDEDFDLEPLAGRVRAVLVAAGHARQRVHAIGYSTGACVALAYAALWPGQADLLTLAAPLLRRGGRDSGGGGEDSGGVGGGEDSGGGGGDSGGGGGDSGGGGGDSGGGGGDSGGGEEDSGGPFDSEIFDWLLPFEPDQLPVAFRRRAYRPLSGSVRMRRAWLEDRLPRLDFHRALLANLTEEPNSSRLLQLAEGVQAAAHIVWGLQDEISPVAGAELLKRRLRSVAQTDILDECGHSIEMECPGVLYNLVYKFRKNQSLKKYN